MAALSLSFARPDPDDAVRGPLRAAWQCDESGRLVCRWYRVVPPPAVFGVAD